jgi:hypothetical protein
VLYMYQINRSVVSYSPLGGTSLFPPLQGYSQS